MAAEGVFSWGGSNFARGWSGPSSTGAGPAQRVIVRERSLATSRVALQGRALVAASRNSVASTSDGRILTWGFNDSRGGGDAWFVRGGHLTSVPDSGQLGRQRDGSTSRSRKPEAPGAISLGPLAAEGASALASGRYHALAIGLGSQTVYSWGLNDHGQLGRSGWAESRLSYGSKRSRAREKPPRSCMRGSRCRDGTPLPVEGMPAALAVAAGRYFSAAIGTDGRAYAWGRCACGRGALASQPSKRVDRPGGDEEELEGMGAADAGSSRHGNWRGAAIGGYQPYALTGGGVESDRLVAVSAGYAHLLLLGASGTVYSCESGDDGYGGRLKTAPPHNAFGQLGRGGPPLVPLPIPGLRLATRTALPTSWPGRSSFAASSAARLIAAGRCASFASDANGAVYGWGCAQANGHGGNRSSASASPSASPRPPADVRAPLQLEALRGVAVRMLAAGEYHALALTSPCGLVAWGAAASGAGGAGGMVPVDGLPTAAAAAGGPPCEVLDIAAGYQHSLAVVRTG